MDNIPLSKSSCLNVLIFSCFQKIGLVVQFDSELFSLLQARWDSKFTENQIIDFFNMDFPQVLFEDFETFYYSYIGGSENAAK